MNERYLKWRAWLSGLVLLGPITACVCAPADTVLEIRSRFCLGDSLEPGVMGGEACGFVAEPGTQVRIAPTGIHPNILGFEVQEEQSVLWSNDDISLTNNAHFPDNAVWKPGWSTQPRIEALASGCTQLEVQVVLTPPREELDDPNNTRQAETLTFALDVDHNATGDSILNEFNAVLRVPSEGEVWFVQSLQLKPLVGACVFTGVVIHREPLEAPCGG